MRSFVAVPIPAEARRMLQETQTRLRACGGDVRWTSIDSIHLTLKFLGEIDSSMLPQLTEGLSVAVAAHRSFTVQLRGLGTFPDLRAPRVVWCGIEGELQKLESLQEAVKQACAREGFPAEPRAFRPHLTLGRVRSKRNLHRLVDCIKIPVEHDSCFEVNQVNLYESTLTPSGALYDVLAQLPLRGQEL